MTPSRPPPDPPPQPDVAPSTYALYGLVAGAVLMLAGLAVILFDVFAEASDMRVLGFGIALVLLGGAAALPKTFVPILGAALKKIPGRGEALQPPAPPEDLDPKP